MRSAPIYQEEPHSLRMIDKNFQISLTKSQVTLTQLHHHEYVELSLVTEGLGTETVNGQSHRLQQGTVTFLLPHHVHQIRAESEAPIQKYCCMFNLDLFHSTDSSELFTLLLQVGTTVPSWVDIPPGHMERIKNLLEDIEEELSGIPSIGQALLVKAKLTEALLLFIRTAYRNQSELHSKIAINDSANNLVHSTFWPLLSYIRTHYQDTLTLHQLAEQFHVSIAHISRSFKRHLGISFIDYIHLLRTNNAASLLASTTMSIMEISLAVGFDSLRTFSRVFRTVYGQTPSEYRKVNQSVK